jgi:Fe-S-cluster containining protein
MIDPDPISTLRLGVEQAKDRGKLIAALKNYMQTADDYCGALIEEEAITIGCKSGCSYCCYLRVDAYPHEIFTITDHIDARYTASEREALIARLESHNRALRNLTPDDSMKASLPCPLLRDSVCSIYRIRPFACRFCHSVTVDPCREWFESPETSKDSKKTNPTFEQFWSGVMMGSLSIFRVHGFDCDAYELGGGLLAALTNPAHGRRWQQRKKVFPGLRAS